MTEPQVREFTNDLDRIAVAIGTLRQNAKLGNGSVLTEKQQDDLLINQIRLLRASAKFSSQAIALDGDMIQQQLNQLNVAILSIDHTLARMKTVDQVIGFSTLALNIAVAVTSGDIISVSTSLNTLLSSISDINS